MTKPKREWPGDFTPEQLAHEEAKGITRHTLPDGSMIRRNKHGARLCRAHSRQTHKPCELQVQPGALVCRLHGGAKPEAQRKAKLRLAELVDPAIATLAREMTRADKSGDKQRAANSILDRAGYGRVTRVETEDAKDMLTQRLLKIRDEAEAEVEEGVGIGTGAPTSSEGPSQAGDSTATDEESH